MKNSEMKKLFAIPNSTLHDWKKRTDYRKKMMDFLEKISFQEAVVILSRTDEYSDNYEKSDDLLHE